MPFYLQIALGEIKLAGAMKLTADQIEAQGNTILSIRGKRGKGRDSHDQRQ
jgi:hypothetical protein